MCYADNGGGETFLIIVIEWCPNYYHFYNTKVPKNVFYGRG